jgi:hypothetical protein
MRLQHLHTRVIDDAEAAVGTDRTSETLLLVLQAAERLKRPIAELQVLRAMLAGMAARGGDPKYYYLMSGAWLEQLKRDSGYYDWHGLSEIEDPLARIRSALGCAAERHKSSPIELQGVAPGEAIKQMTGYVIMSIAVSVRLMDLRLQQSLPDLLEPWTEIQTKAWARTTSKRSSRSTAVIGKRRNATATTPSY